MIAEANRLGIMVDISHPSKQANLQAIALSKAPVIASHSGARAVADHSRNLDDEQLLALKKNGGVAQAVALGGYVKVTNPSPERDRGTDRAGKGVRIARRGSARPRRARRWWRRWRPWPRDGGRSAGQRLWRGWQRAIHRRPGPARR